MQVMTFFVTFAFIFLVLGFVGFYFFAIQVCLASYDMYDSGKKLRQRYLIVVCMLWTRKKKQQL